MNKSTKRAALVVLSGGQDSTTCLALAAHRHEVVHAVSFDYGQRHHRELAAAASVAVLCGVASHEIVKLGTGILASTSPLVSATELEQYRTFAEMDSIIGDRVEKTFVPMRNALFLTIAANRAVALGCDSIYTGVCEADNANYPDCRSDFIDAQEKAINEALGVGARITIETPLISLSKSRSIGMLHNSLNALWLLAFTHTAYDGAYPPLGHDHATMLRAEGFEQAGVPDPLIVRAVTEGLMDLPITTNYAGGVWDWHGQAMHDLRGRIGAGKAALMAAMPNMILGGHHELVRQHLGAA